MRLESIFSITLILTTIIDRAVIKGSPIAGTTEEPGIVERNPNETAIEFEIEIPIEVKRKEDVDGLAYFFNDFHETGFPINDKKVKICVVVTFPTKTDDKNASFCEIELNYPKYDDVCVERCAVNRSTCRSGKWPSSDPYHRYHSWHACKEHTSNGATRIRLFMRKVAETSEWDRSSKELVEKMASEGKGGLVIVGNNFGNETSVSTPFRLVVYEIGKPPKNVWNSTDAGGASFFGTGESKKMINFVWSHILKLLARCNVTVRQSGCHYSKRDVCSLRYRREGRVDDPADKQYCPGNDTYRNDTNCTKEKCDANCRLHEQPTECSATCGEGQQRVVIYDLNTNPHLYFCPVNIKETYVKCVVDCKPSSEGIAMVTMGVLILCGIGALVFAGYWFLWRRRPGPPRQASGKKAAQAPILTPMPSLTAENEGQQEAATPAEEAGQEGSKKSQDATPSNPEA